MRPQSYAPSPVARFAPSPNGALHLGHAYSALCNERFAAASNARLLLRIEDLDRARCKAEYEAAILDDLNWLGLTFDGPARRQSEHRGDYAAALERLSAKELVYPCFCSRSEVAREARGLRDPDGAPLYSGSCRFLEAKERRVRLTRGDSAAWRLDMRRAFDATWRRLSWLEYGEGGDCSEHTGESALWGDIILRGRDLAASYHLAVVVDDALQRVTDVVRGRDLFAATSVHRLLQELLALPAPRYRHHRLVLDQTGAKLAKSRCSLSLAELRRRGLKPSEIRAALGFADGPGGGLAVALS